MGSKYVKNKLFGLLTLSILLFSSSLHAKTVVLVHGFMGDGNVWKESHFVAPLIQAGWKEGGSYNYNPWGIQTPQGINIKGDVFFTVNLPSQANLQIQESVLQQYLHHLYASRIEAMTLVGHSAGGIVARLYILNPAHQPVNGLITIASPHLGTPTANIALLASNSPIGMMTSMIGEDSLQNSRGLFSDLKEEKPYNFLFWMNHQPHPDIHYASIIRKNSSISKPKSFDYVVPSASQNMNNIWALRGRSGTAHSAEGHLLSSKDGNILLNILSFIH